jgi:histidine triad (HIT) family protein
VLLIPKKEIASVDDIGETDEALIGHLFVVARKIAAKLGLSGGYRVVTNCGPDSGQEVMHLHFHILAGRRLGWPPG